VIEQLLRSAQELPAGFPWPQVLLMSRDETSMLVVSYADIRRCIATCYDELKARASPQFGAGGIGGSGGPGGAQGGMPRSRSRHSMQQQY
jgi:PAB-dependent poly(A)-specific ribonuclease subunit 3